MSLEERLIHQQRTSVVRRYPSDQALEQLKQGKKFVVVEEEFDQSFVPEGYTLINMKHRGNCFRSLVPQVLLFYMANPGEGDTEDALEEIADFYDDAEDFEDDMIEEGETSVQETNWATLARNSYQTYLINRLVKHRKGEKEDGEPVPEFNHKVVYNLDLNDDYVVQRTKAIAALALGKTVDEINTSEIRDVLKHVTIREQKTEELSREEFEEVTCWAGSHYELKPEYRNRNDVQYEIQRRCDYSCMVGSKTTKSQRLPVLDAKISELEQEIVRHRTAKHGQLGRHDSALIRQYVNLAYIASEDPGAQLNITPPGGKNE